MSQDLDDKARKRGPNIRIPPAFFIAGFLLGLLLHAAVGPLPLSRGEQVRLLATAGWIAAALGLLLSISGIVTFHRAGTTMFPFEPAKRMVQHGPYRFTRNPMYFGNTITYAGFALVVNSAWPLLILPVVLYALVVFVIRPEERYLTEMFGDEYRAYRRRVRRWF